MGDVGGGIAYSSLPGTLSLCKDAAVLTHQRTVRKCRRLCQGPEDYYKLCRLLLGIEMPYSDLKGLFRWSGWCSDI